MSAKTTHLKAFCENHPALVTHEDRESLCLIVMSPPSAEDINQLAFTCQKKIAIKTVSKEEYCTSQQPATPSLSLHEEYKGEDSPTTIEYCQAILCHAVQKKASDIHIEPYAQGARIRLRVDGVLYIYGELSPLETNAISSRFKLLAGADIAENRRPQDGQLSLTYQDIEYSFRLATLPTRFGEKIVLRLLETFRGDLALENLGISSPQLSLLRAALASPQGLIIVTGPTGSGKTATLYSALNHLNSAERNLCSVEDPIELVIPGINQTQINLKAGLDFPTILRALLRQDPDILMIGEIRDNQTADIAIKAAQTGHLVLSTLHTNSTIETLSRLTQMGVIEYLAASALRLIIAQRLVRRLCVRCRIQSPDPLPSYLALQSFEHWLAIGCRFCVSGYLGRHALFELLPVDAAIRHAIIQRTCPQKIRALLREREIQNLFEAGLNAVTQGVTTYQELLRVVGGENEAA
ncbi:Flp pilus assembly complex ATPase component TadA [Rosenbergiella sp. S61]|uniref:Flp pilus assembly complex ATPase component TadA n=1 Tax=Rosenbergiella gaditana TaxID=2726987 RepID=A0ABS5SYI0_9GAMM|nr:ATPase, T2SS/T4P/T4SS family [Rosenbergiella gaditana]MBT0724305.1 Flp pilus assembly complex ATPase component TadA [Rosenbergiella gaditana]